MRVFVALMPSTNSVELISSLSDHASGWHGSQDFHMTLRFLGDKSNSQVQELKSELDSCRAETAIHCSIDRMGFFPSSDTPRTWALEGVMNTEIEGVLNQLAKLPSLQVMQQRMVFRPHVSLCEMRFINGNQVEELFASKEKAVDLQFDRLVLLQSKQKRAISEPRYQIIWQQSLTEQVKS